VARAGAACANETTYACTYNQTSHTVSCPSQIVATWNATPDTGSDQFGLVGSGSASPQGLLLGMW
jgi:hypothetical protein